MDFTKPLSIFVICLLILGGLILLNLPMEKSVRSYLDVNFSQQNKSIDTFSASNAEISMGPNAVSGPSEWSNFEFKAYNTSALSLDFIEFLNLSSNYPNGINVNVYNNSNSSSPIDSFQCQHLTSGSVLDSYFPVTDLYSEFSTGSANFSTDAYWLNVHGSFLNNSSVFWNPLTDKPGLLSQDTQDTFYLSINSIQIPLSVSINLHFAYPFGSALSIGTMTSLSTPIMMYADLNQISISQGDYIRVSGFTNAGVQMIGYGTYNIPQSSLLGVLLTSEYPFFSSLEINSTTISSYSNGVIGKTIHAPAVLNSSGQIQIDTSLANSKNTVVPTLFFEVTADNALLLHSNKSVYTIDFYPLQQYKAAISVALGTLLGYFFTKLPFESKRKKSK